MRIVDIVNIPPGATEIRLAIRVTPRAKKTEYAGTLADGVHKIRVRAVPEEGRANAELRRYLAEEFGVRADRVTIVVGASDSRKVVQIGFA